MRISFAAERARCPGRCSLRGAAFGARAVLLALLLAAGSAAANDAGLRKAKELYQNADYEECLAVLARTPRAAPAREEQVERSLYAGLCSANLGKRQKAIQHFQRALELNRSTTLPPYVSPKVVKLFELAASRLPPEPVPVPAPEPPVAERPAPGAPSGPPSDAPLAETKPPPPSLIPPPGEPPTGPHLAAAEAGAPSRGSLVLPITAGALALGAAGTSAFFAVRTGQLNRQAQSAVFESDALTYRQQAITSSRYMYGFAGAAVLLAGTAVITYFWQTAWQQPAQ